MFCSGRLGQSRSPTAMSQMERQNKIKMALVKFAIVKGDLEISPKFWNIPYLLYNFPTSFFPCNPPSVVFWDFAHQNPTTSRRRHPRRCLTVEKTRARCFWANQYNSLTWIKGIWRGFPYVWLQHLWWVQWTSRDRGVVTTLYKKPLNSIQGAVLPSVARPRIIIEMIEVKNHYMWPLGSNYEMNGFITRHWVEKHISYSAYVQQH